VGGVLQGKEHQAGPWSREAEARQRERSQE
jgi:hypothetical protein